MRRQNKPHWGEADRQLVLRIRQENPAYGKEKIAVILKRDHGKSWSASTVGRILKALFAKPLWNTFTNPNQGQMSLIQPEPIQLNIKS